MIIFIHLSASRHRQTDRQTDRQATEVIKYKSYTSYFPYIVTSSYIVNERYDNHRDRQTDRQTDSWRDGHRAIAYTELCIALHVRRAVKRPMFLLGSWRTVWAVRDTVRLLITEETNMIVASSKRHRARRPTTWNIPVASAAAAAAAAGTRAMSRGTFGDHNADPRGPFVLLATRTLVDPRR